MQFGGQSYRPSDLSTFWSTYSPEPYQQGWDEV